MKHRLPILLVALIAAGGPLLIVADCHAAPPVSALDEILDQARAAFELRRSVDHATAVDPATFAIEASAAVELAWLPLDPAPAWIERARCLVPPPSVASGHRIHAWTAPARHWLASVSRDPLGPSWNGLRDYDRLA